MSSLLSPDTKRACRNGCKRASPFHGILNFNDRKTIKLHGASYTISNATPQDDTPRLLDMEETSLQTVGGFLNLRDVYHFGLTTKKLHFIEVDFNGHLTSSKFAYDNPNTMYRWLLRDPAETRCVEHMKKLSPKAFDALASVSNQLGRMTILASGKCSVSVHLQTRSRP